MSRTRALRLYFVSVKCLPRASSSSGLEAGLLTRKSSTCSTMPDAQEVGPDPVGERGGEPRVLGRGQPLGQHDAAVLARDVGRLAAQELGRHDPAADGVVHLAAARVEDDRLAIVLALLAADLGEERREAVVVVLGPAVERVVVALGALDADSHEHLGDVLGQRQRFVGDLVEVGRRVLERAAAGARAAPGPSRPSACSSRACRPASCNRGTSPSG